MAPPIARIYGGSLTSAVALTLVAWGIRALRGAALRRHLPGAGGRARVGGPDARLVAALAQSAKRLARAPAPLSAVALCALLELAPFPHIVVDVREEAEAEAHPLTLPEDAPLVRVPEDGLLAAFNPQSQPRGGAAVAAGSSSEADASGHSSPAGSSPSGVSWSAPGCRPWAGESGASTSGEQRVGGGGRGEEDGGAGGGVDGRLGGLLPPPRGTLVVFVSGNPRQARRCAAFMGSLGHLKTAYLRDGLEALQGPAVSAGDPELIGRDAVAALLGLVPGVSPVRQGRGAARSKAAAAICTSGDFPAEGLSDGTGSDVGHSRKGVVEAEEPPPPSPRGLLGGGLGINSSVIQQRLGLASNPVLSGLGGLISGGRAASSADAAEGGLRGRDEPGTERCFVVDVRRHDERALFGAIPGTLHLPAQQALRAVHLSEEEWECAFRFSRPRIRDTVVLLSRTNQRAIWAAEIFRSHGLGRALVYEQGTYGWHLGEDVKQYASYGEGEPPPEPEVFDVESSMAGAAMAELSRLELSAFVSAA